MGLVLHKDMYFNTTLVLFKPAIPDATFSCIIHFNTTLVLFKHQAFFYQGQEPRRFQYHTGSIQTIVVEEIPLLLRNFNTTLVLFKPAAKPSKTALRRITHTTNFLLISGQPPIMYFI